MTPFNLRSLLLAAIFLSNCITWTASRHHYTHNVNGHRSRHRRQGAGLFLSASYVLPGGEGSGWGEWGEVSPCSRTCGGGVASQKRICLQIGSDGQPQCNGGDTKYFSCQTQDCPTDTDFRAEQCSQFDDQLFRDIKYRWVPYTKAPNPCELNCMPHAERFYYRHKAKVVDGTRCSDESFDVCVNGTCQPVGCDMMLGSGAKEDKCRKCRGNNDNCRTTSGLLDTTDLKGYNDILLIPAGATTIIIAEVGPSSNYLALRAMNGTFYLNGDYHIDFPRNLYIAGALWSYERSQQGFAAPDKLRCQGPTSEPVILSLLLQDENVGINYEYSLPADKAPLQNKRYNWVHEEYLPCNATCGGGFQTRAVSCRSREELEVVDDGLCDEVVKPPTSQSCNTQACDPQWVASDWGQCSKRCGEGGTRSRNIICQKIITNGNPSIVAEDECFNLHGPKPELFQKCNENVTCPTWFTGPWKPCNKLCDEGKQTRQVVCYQKNGRRIEVLGDEQCEEEQPPKEKPCMMHPCVGVDWVVSPWNGCDSCLSKIRTRRVVCATRNHVVVDDSFCAYHPMPSTEETCDSAELPACEYQWYATQWSNCSVRCGKGVHTRKVFCGLFDGSGVTKVDESLCADQLKYEDTKPCEIPEEKCPSQWYTGPWSNCTKKCGPGVQVRRVMCLHGEEMASDCAPNHPDPVPEPSRSCNLGPCTSDKLIPADDLIECEDEEEEDDFYSEVGLDDVTAIDRMYSDGSSTVEGSGMAMWSTTFAELESKFIDTDSTLSTDELITVEDSGTGSTETLFTDDLTAETGSGSTTLLLTDDTESTVSSASSALPADTSSTEPSTASSDSSSTESTMVDDSGEIIDAPDDSSNTTSGKSVDSTTVKATYSIIDDTESSDITTEADSSAKSEETDSSDVPTTKAADGVTVKATYSIGTEDDEDIISTTEIDLSLISAHTEIGSTLSTEESVTSETTSSENTETSETESSGATESTETTESDSTDTTNSDSTETTESGPTETIEASEATESDSTGSTNSGPTSEITEASETTESDSMGTTESGPTDTSETTVVDETTSSDSAGTTESGPTGSTELAEASSTSETTESSATGTSEPTETTESGSTDTSESNETTESGPTETTEVTESGATGTSEPTETTESGPTETTESDSTDTSESTETTESGPTESTESTETSSTEARETSESGATESIETTESSSTDTSEPTETTESGPTETTETTESGATDTTESTETTESGPTESTEATETASTESTSTSSDSESSTSSDMFTTEAGFTSAAVWFTSKKPRMCRPKTCLHTMFGCCPDKKTAAKGPFEEECSNATTCKQTKHGCCPDGVSPASGPDGLGCPEVVCAETLYGCCESDNKTAAGGNDQEDCPPPPPPCKSSAYGCCKDGETEATGPAKEGCPETTVPETEPPTSTTSENESTTSVDETTTPMDETTTSVDETTTLLYEGCESTTHGCCYDNATTATGPDMQGCPCSTSEYGCCYDGVSPAQGPAYEGCLKSCNSSTYGCCPDGKTPAHGPNAEGCCLRSAYGCCSDNYNYARGPNLEGCRCEHSPYGCCPDNATSATGHNNEGCGCSYSPHGCCPDGHTEASGPGFGGCACHTYQFGCCPDGVTIASGPYGQGCNCLQSPYKCCGDEKTHATGPNQEGCDCSSSEYGCCPDGKTEATGSKFKGCTDAPENRQAACGLKFDRGPCRNYTVYWYFDTEYGGCSRFWYGGCDGNGNRFATKEECDDTCVSPPPKEACQLPYSKGACLSYNVRWYYNSTQESCINFAYGGCLGNNNNFETRELCQKQCEPEKTTDQCSLPIERGSCAGNFSRWGFNQDSRRCEQFTWGGCEGNPNRFNTEDACNLQCNPPGQPKPECSEAEDVGLCSETEAVWSFSQSKNRCVPFYYSGCGGTGNRFISVDSCQAACPSAYVPDKCTLPYETGTCSNYREKWYFDTKEQTCRLFYYGGCDGNENNFDSETECLSQCRPEPSTTAAPQPTTPRQQAQPAAQRQDFCFLDVDAGPCSNYQNSWAYDYKSGRCITFRYGGCGGNRNNFPEQRYCEYYCNATQDTCQLPMLVGPCQDSQMRWFYDASTDSCNQFTYGGCKGNDNRFESRDACERRCKTGPTAEQTTITTTIVLDPSLPTTCAVSPTLQTCTFEHAGEVWYRNPSTQECVSHQNLATGRSCRTTGVFSSQEGCERSCGAFRDINVCGYPLDAGSCSNYISKYFYNGTSGQCEEFTYGGCMGGPNRFSTELECTDICKSTIDVCKQQPEPGNCLARYEHWYYDETTDQCRMFIYGGCGGNDNRFESQRDCEGRCKKQPGEVVVATTTPANVQSLAPECVTPKSLEPCGSNATAFYYDAQTSTCRAAQFGGCIHPNMYASEEECERSCGAFVSIDVCRARVDPGPCRAAIPKYFYDAASGTCKEFAYGGCQGGANRFSTSEECEDICKDSLLAPRCLQEVEIGEACETLPSRRWFYSAARAGCLVFAYQGCGGNDNNFLSYEECAASCDVTSLDTETQAALCNRYSEECETLHSTCEYRIKVYVATEGCERCSCEPPNCESQQEECDSIQCTYGVNRIAGDDGCESCVCVEDPCARANCTSSERCVASAYRDPATQNVQYTAHCVSESEDNNVLPECEEYEQHCAQLSCPYGVQRTMSSRGCVRCACVQEEVDCTLLRQECDHLRCNYGIERVTGDDGCERCKCLQPCGSNPCSEAERCIQTQYREAVTQVNRYVSECRLVVKPGVCPADNARSTETSCQPAQCNDDADCRGVGKCCSRGCNRLCLNPEEMTTTTPAPATQHITTYSPDAPQAPRVSTETEPEVAVAEGGKATLRCLFHGNPPPRITWRFGEITIDGDRDRYRLMSDGALEIVALVRNDSGVYVCVAVNDLGTAQQEIQLLVKDPVDVPASIAGDAGAVIVGELGHPLQVRCRAYGHPQPLVYWNHGISGALVPFSNVFYEVRDQIMTIKSLAVDTLGVYTCSAYNGLGKAATWTVKVQAYQVDDNAIDQYLVPAERMVAVTPRPALTTSTASTTSTTTTTTIRAEYEIPLYIVPVKTELQPASTVITVGRELSLPCDVDGYPEPRVTWTKDGVKLFPTDSMWITETRLTIPRVTMSDSGLYGCNAVNQYSSHSSTVQIQIQENVIPAQCTDSSYFADCALIVQGKFCKHHYYSKFCCKSCVEAGQLDPSEVNMQSDGTFRKK